MALQFSTETIEFNEIIRNGLKILYWNSFLNPFSLL